MAIAYLIVAHKSPDQVLRLIHALRDSSAFFVVHVDKRAGDDVYAPLREYAALHPEVLLTKRNRCYWGGFGIAKAMIECVNTAVRARRHFHYAILLSGQDYPIKNAQQIAEFFEQNKGKEFMESFSLARPNRWTDHGAYFQAMARVKYWSFFVRSHVFHLRLARKFPSGWEPHGGSQWWGLSRDCIQYLERAFRARPDVIRYFRHVFIPDESLFQTVIANEPRFSSRIVHDDLRHIDWERPNPQYPRTLDMEDFERVRASSKLFARKFDVDRSKDLLDRIDTELLSTAKVNELPHRSLSHGRSK